MTRMASPATVAIAADYADAMMTARRAKNWVFLLLLLMLLVQLALFFVAKFMPDLRITVRGDGQTIADVPVNPTTGPVEDRAVEPVDRTAGVNPPAVETGRGKMADVFKYVIGLIVFLAPVLSVLLGVVLLVLVLIMLVGRLIGVSNVTSALIWCALLALLVFPWQAFLDPFTFKIPGVIYTWEELQRAEILRPRSPGEDVTLAQNILQWARFVGFPVLALLILLAVQVKSSRGLKFALGESDVQIDIKSPTP